MRTKTQRTRQTRKRNQFNQQVGERIAAARAERNFSQCALAAQIGITASSLCLVEAGQRACRLRVLLAIARCLDLPLESFLPEISALSMRRKFTQL